MRQGGWRKLHSGTSSGGQVADGVPVSFEVWDNSSQLYGFDGATAGGEFNGQIDVGGGAPNPPQYSTLRVYFDGGWKATFYDGDLITEQYQWEGGGSSGTIPQGGATEWTFLGGTNNGAADGFKWYSMFNG